MRRPLLAAALLLSVLTVAPAPAHAVALNNGLLIGPGISETPFSEADIVGAHKVTQYGTATGLLAADTKIYFTYTVDLDKTGSGSWEFVVKDADGNPFAGKIEGETKITSEKDNDMFAAILALMNPTESAISFKIFLESKKEAIVSPSYRTEQISSVPLPAALPLFGLGLVGLAGYRRARKAR